jgi:hypothetical protein
MPESCFRHPTRPIASQHGARTLTLEPLEDRVLLSFFPAKTFAAGGQAVAVGKFRPGAAPSDLAVADRSLDQVNVLLGNGHGAFRQPLVSPVHDGPIDLAVGDLNGDAHQDIVTADFDSSCCLSILFGMGRGNFQPAKKLDIVGNYPSAVGIGDFNGDGINDLIATGYYGHFYAVSLGNGDGTFQSAVYSPSSLNPVDLTIGDFNGDGKLDAASILPTPSSSLAVSLGKGNGEFELPAGYYDVPEPWQVTAADANGDGKVDLLTANGGTDTVSILLGHGDGSFASPVNMGVGTGSAPADIVVADFSRDSKADFVVSKESIGMAAEYDGTGGGVAYALDKDYTVGSSPAGLTTADFDGDGWADVAVANKGSSDVSVLLNKAPGLAPGGFLDYRAVRLAAAPAAPTPAPRGLSIRSAVPTEGPVDGSVHADGQSVHRLSVGTLKLRPALGVVSVYDVFDLF